MRVTMQRDRDVKLTSTTTVTYHAGKEYDVDDKTAKAFIGDKSAVVVGGTPVPVKPEPVKPEPAKADTPPPAADKAKAAS